MWYTVARKVIINLQHYVKSNFRNCYSLLCTDGYGKRAPLLSSRDRTPLSSWENPAIVAYAVTGTTWIAKNCILVLNYTVYGWEITKNSIFYYEKKTCVISFFFNATLGILKIDLAHVGIQIQCLSSVFLLTTFSVKELLIVGNVGSDVCHSTALL